MTDTPDHFCPGCGAPQKAFLRYPWHLCNACRESAVDGAGRGLDFSNASVSGGFMFRYAGDGDGDWITCRAVLALIAHRPVYITEARFGGIVAEPLRSEPQSKDDRVHDLRRGERVAKPEPKPRGIGRGRPSSAI